MATIHRFEDIEAWKEARLLVSEIYRVSDTGAFARDFGLRDQIRRAAVSNISNIAEGFERDGGREFLQNLSVAKGSCGEVRAQLYVALDLGYLDPSSFAALTARSERVSRLLSRFMTYLRNSPINGNKFKPADRTDLKPQT